jgi:choline-glycine betaine transporter
MPHLVYCPKCGTKNEDTAEFCVKCGASLQTGTYTSRRYERRRAEEQCFGLPHGGAIVTVVIGVIILLWGGLLLAQQAGWIATSTPDFWVVILIIIGVLMIAGAAYRMTRPRPTPP